MTRRTKTESDRTSLPGPVLPRRKVLKGGLAGLAAAMMSRTLIGCDSSAGPLDAGRADAGGPMDAGGPDAGPIVFEPRDLPDPPPLRSLMADLGPLGDPDENGLRLPAGFRSRVIGRSGQLVADSEHEWHLSPDGGATFLTEDGGWIYVSNAEIPLVGGVSAVRFDASGEITSAYRVLDDTHVNCAGGKTPWHTWLSCEEIARGKVYECDPWGERPAVARPALGVFKHEAVAVDPVNAHLYLTEDEGDGCLYRFVPSRLTSHGHPDLSSGQLEVAEVAADGAVAWHALPDPQYEGPTATRRQLAQATRFRGGEGIWYHDGVVYFSTKGDDKVWAYDVEASRLSTLYDRATSATPVLSGVDNLTVSCCGDVLVAEDGGDMEVCVVLPSGEARSVVQVVGHPSSEVTGPAFDPSGTRLYFSSQRGSDGAGVTYEVEGPFHEPL